MSTPEMTIPAQASDILAWSRDLVDPALRQAVDTMPSKLRLITGYHLGWWDQAGRPIRLGAGKALRPALALVAGEAVAGTPAAALPAAVAVELVHNFSLLQDDVMDRDVTRRHRPAAWTVYGTGAAILAGDALLSLAFATLAQAPGAAGAALLGAAVNDMLAGQLEDLEFESRSYVSVAECRDMAAGKTGALLGCACAAGAWAAGAGPALIENMAKFGRHLGLAFQFSDDLLGIWGDPARTGKPVYSDLSRRKKTLPVVMALLSGTPEGGRLAELYRRQDTLTSAELRQAAELAEAAGARQWCLIQIGALLDQAETALAQAGIPPPAQARLMALANFAADRDR